MVLMPVHINVRLARHQNDFMYATNVCWTHYVYKHRIRCDKLDLMVNSALQCFVKKNQGFIGTWENLYPSDNQQEIFLFFFLYKQNTCM